MIIILQISNNNHLKNSSQNINLQHIITINLINTNSKITIISLINHHHNLLPISMTCMINVNLLMLTLNHSLNIAMWYQLSNIKMRFLPLLAIISNLSSIPFIYLSILIIFMNRENSNILLGQWLNFIPFLPHLCQILINIKLTNKNNIDKILLNHFIKEMFIINQDFKTINIQTIIDSINHNINLIGIINLNTTQLIISLMSNIILNKIYSNPNPILILYQIKTH